MRVVVLFALIASGGCKEASPFECAADLDCGADGACEANGFCSFADASCSGGRRFGALSGSVAGQCVGSIGNDAGVDTPRDCPNDVDCDGVADGADNCPNVQNADQADEDGDGRGDACDLCPPFADNNEDADGDGVGDLCDPNPNTPGDAFVSFSGFKQGLPAGWTTTGSFVATAGDGVATAAANQGATLMLPAAGTRYTVSAQATLDSIDGVALGAIGVSARHGPGTDNNVVCQLVGTAAGATQELRLFDTNAGVQLGGTAHAFTAGSTYTLRIRRDGDSYDCDATNPVAQTSGSSTFGPGGPELGLRVRSATAHFHWVMVVRSP